jgi:hypothetical protein
MTLMRDRFPTCEWPDDPSKFYGHLMYHEWFFGPFDTLRELADLDAARRQDDPSWGHDPFTVYRGGGPSREGGLGALIPVERLAWDIQARDVVPIQAEILEQTAHLSEHYRTLDEREFRNALAHLVSLHRRLGYREAHRCRCGRWVDVYECGHCLNGIPLP